MDSVTNPNADMRSGESNFTLRLNVQTLWQTGSPPSPQLQPEDNQLFTHFSDERLAPSSFDFLWIRSVYFISASFGKGIRRKREKSEMQKRIVRIGICVALLLTGYAVGSRTSPSIHAEMRVSIPGSYGKLVAGDSSSLWFEDTSGTLRQVTIPAGNTIFTINRQR